MFCKFVSKQNQESQVKTMKVLKTLRHSQALSGGAESNLEMNTQLWA